MIRGQGCRMVLVRRGRCRIELAGALLDPPRADMALHRDADMVWAIAGTCRVKFLSGFAGGEGKNALAQAWGLHAAFTSRRLGCGCSWRSSAASRGNRSLGFCDKDAEAVWNANSEEGLEIAKATNAKEAWSARGNMPTIHLMGGTIMGPGSANSVVNSYGQTHEIPNLYLAGPGIFATAGASNPTYTIFALSLRGAEQLAAEWSTVAG